MPNYDIKSAQVTVSVESEHSNLQLRCGYANYQSVGVVDPVCVAIVDDDETTEIIVSKKQFLRWLNLVGEML